MPLLNLYARVRFFVHVCTRDRGCSAHPAFPAPSSYRGRQSTQSSGASCRGVVNSCLESTCLKASLRSNGSRECAPDDRLRDAIHLFLFVATMDCFVANAPRNDASACVAIPSTVIGLAEGENRWWRGDDGAAPTAARQPAPQEFAPTNECPCGSFAGRIFRSANGCCRRPDRSPPAPCRDRACA